ncbi:MAG: hypothetical protein ACRES7_09405 [Gammaproteobacteria bacterium]
MRTANNQDGGQRRVKNRFTTDFWVFIAGGALVAYFRPFAHLFPALEAYEEVHRATWPEVVIYATAWAAIKTIYLWGFRRAQQHQEIELVKEDIKRGRIARPSFAVRWLFILCLLALVSLGWFGTGTSRSHLLAPAIPLFLLFVAMELNIVIHPGEALIPDRRDELLTFFKARMLQAGYITAVATLAILYLIYLFAPNYVGLVLPVVLVLCLLVPALVYRRLDHRAAADG